MARRRSASTLRRASRRSSASRLAHCRTPRRSGSARQTLQAAKGSQGIPETAPYGPSWRIARVAYGTVGAIATVVMAAAAGPWHGSVPARAVTILAPTLAALVAGSMALLRARFLPDQRRIAWMLLGVACLAWA